MNNVQIVCSDTIFQIVSEGIANLFYISIVLRQIANLFYTDLL